MELQPWLMLIRTLPKHPRYLRHIYALNSIARALPNVPKTSTWGAAVERDASSRLRRHFACASRHSISVRSDTSDSQPADKLSHNITQEEKDHYKKAAEHGRSQQIRTPWQREGPDTPPAEKDPSKEAMSEGKMSFLCKTVLVANKIQERS